MRDDYANQDGKKVKRIMKASGNVYYQYPNGVISTGGGLTK
jgi:hypothetical protein